MDRKAGLELIDTEKFRNDDNGKLEEALLMAFDPYANKEVMELLKHQNKTNELTQDQLKGYYKFGAWSEKISGMHVILNIRNKFFRSIPPIEDKHGV